MVFEFKNLGIIESANIELKGLTIITGLNDTGKSFISKTIFSVIKTANDSKDNAITEKGELIGNLINQIFSAHRQVIPFTQLKVQEFNPNSIAQRIFNGLYAQGSGEDVKKLFHAYIERVKQDIHTSANPGLEPQKLASLQRIDAISNTVNVLLNDDGGDDERKFKAFFDKIIIQKLFQGQLNSINGKDSVATIKLKEGESDILNIAVKDNKSTEFSVTNLLLLDDATIIDTPTIIQLARFITSTLAYPANLKKLYSQRSDLQYTYYDLLEKINIPGGVSPEFLDIFNEIKQVIGGELTYQIEESSFVYEKENGVLIKAFNIATGIKSFGLIQLLLNSGSLNSNTVLIIDEPEVHLHPKWEVIYAKIIVLLSKRGIPIIISSHSAYFLQGLTRYIKEYDTQDITKVYFGEKIIGKETTRFTDVTDNLEPIFKALSKPMQDMYLT